MKNQFKMLVSLLHKKKKRYKGELTPNTLPNPLVPAIPISRVARTFAASPAACDFNSSLFFLFSIQHLRMDQIVWLVSTITMNQSGPSQKCRTKKRDKDRDLKSLDCWNGCGIAEYSQRQVHWGVERDSCGSSPLTYFYKC